MKERSQIDDMRAAVRGDLERHRARQQAVQPEPVPERVHAQEPVMQPEPEVVREPEPEPVLQPVSEAVPEEREEKPGGGFLSWLFRRG